MARGSTDTRFSTTAFTYSANGLTNIPRAADTTGVAIGLTGTIPASTWGAIIGYIDGAGTKTCFAAPLSFSSGYANETAAKADVINAQVPANKCQLGVVTIKASSSGWVTGTDALAGGASGNPASVTNYYPTAGITLASGFTGAQLAAMNGTVITV
jgi:hypothetical protein